MGYAVVRCAVMGSAVMDYDKQGIFTIKKKKTKKGGADRLDSVIRDRIAQYSMALA